MYCHIKYHSDRNVKKQLWYTLVRQNVVW